MKLSVSHSALEVNRDDIAEPERRCGNDNAMGLDIFNKTECGCRSWTAACISRSSFDLSAPEKKKSLPNRKKKYLNPIFAL
jgi:hypothetical protein